MLGPRGPLCGQHIVQRVAQLRRLLGRVRWHSACVHGTSFPRSDSPYECSGGSGRLVVSRISQPRTAVGRRPAVHRLLRFSPSLAGTRGGGDHGSPFDIIPCHCACSAGGVRRASVSREARAAATAGADSRSTGGGPLRVNVRSERSGDDATGAGCCAAGPGCHIAGHGQRASQRDRHVEGQSGPDALLAADLSEPEHGHYERRHRPQHRLPGRERACEECDRRDDASGTGNLIVGWDNFPLDQSGNAMSYDRSGSNYLVCGDGNGFGGYGGFVAGYANAPGASFASIGGGATTKWPAGRGQCASMSGGEYNDAGAELQQHQWRTIQPSE